MTHRKVRLSLEKCTVVKRIQPSHQKKSYYKAKERRKVLIFLVSFSVSFIEPKFSIFPTVTAQ